MSPSAQKIVDQLDGTRQKWWVFSLLTTGIWSLSLALGLFVAMMAVDAWAKLSQGPLLAMLCLWLALSITLTVLVVRRLLRSQRSLEATARCVEYEYPELGSSLINVVQLSEDTVNDNQMFCQAAVSQAIQKIGSLRLDNAASSESRWRRFRHCMQTPRDFGESLGAFGLIVMLAIICHMMLPNWSSAASRLMKPWEFVPSVGKIRIEVTPGDVEIPIGSDLDIMAEINLPESSPGPLTKPPTETDSLTDAGAILRATLFIRPEGEDETDMLMTPGEPFTVQQDDGTEQRRQRFTVRLPAITEPLKYRVEVGDSQSKMFAVKLIERPAISEVEITYSYPKYLERPDEMVVQRMPDLEAPQYSTAELRIHTTSPITAGRLDWEGGGITGQVTDDGMLLTASLSITRNSTFTVRLQNGEHTDQDPRLNRIRAVRDNPPTVELLKPPRKIQASAGDEIPVMVRAGDDHGLGQVRLEYKVRSARTGASVPSTTDTTGSFGLDAENMTDADRAAEDAFGDAAESTDAAEDAFDAGFDGSSGDMDNGIDMDMDDNSANGIPDEFGDTSEADDNDNIADAEESSVQTLHQWTTFDNRRSAVVSHRFTLTAEMAVPGQTVYVRAVAVDRRSYSEYGLDLRPQETVGPWRAIEILDKKTDVEATVAQLDNLRMAIFKILEKQIRAQALNAMTTRRETLSDAVMTAEEVARLQVDVQKSTIALVKSIGETQRAERQLIRRRLNQLAFSQMITAVQQCDVMKKASELSAIEQPSSQLYETQSEIVEVLRLMLNVARRAQTEELSEMDDRSEGDLPDDAKQKLEDLNSALEEALEAQRKVVEASENLAKAPVEDFAEEQEQLVKALEAAEDAWDKFMKELNTDMSKLPEQDFANPSMLKELIEIQTEIKMAEDALLAKTKDIAVPLEQLGAEMAEEIKTNMEKWLPDTPDRERWSQEESLSDEGKEAPMAELPGELEDLIGELMEEEEDLFDEMEDVSSSAADSLDKGAGWDAADGPISNMSAKGVTGNRLPNTSEIGGRAGEGRQGKSSGEFVGDEAVGKGGRKTPSRLTEDAFVKGQIKDHSKDPTGGATGGGKESGEGGEGLEGPQPGNRGDRETNRLAGKQADLRNKAEGVDLQHYKVMGYHHTDLQELIEQMSQIEVDLRAGRYQNALRQRKVMLDGLEDVKQHVGGQFDIQQDESANLPTDVHKEILGSMDEASPIGWEQMNRDYFRRLTGSGSGSNGSE